MASVKWEDGRTGAVRDAGERGPAQSRVHASSKSSRGGLRLVHVAPAQGREEPRLRLRGPEEDDPRGTGVGAGRAEPHELVDLVELRVADGRVEPAVLGARVSEDEIQRRVVERASHV